MKTSIGVRLAVLVAAAFGALPACAGQRREPPRRPAAWFMT